MAPGLGRRSREADGSGWRARRSGPGRHPGRADRRVPGGMAAAGRRAGACAASWRGSCAKSGGSELRIDGAVRLELLPLPRVAIERAVIGDRIEVGPGTALRRRPDRRRAGAVGPSRRPHRAARAAAGAPAIGADRTVPRPWAGRSSARCPRGRWPVCAGSTSSTGRCASRCAKARSGRGNTTRST